MKTKNMTLDDFFNSQSLGDLVKQIGTTLEFDGFKLQFTFNDILFYRNLEMPTFVVEAFGRLSNLWLEPNTHEAVLCTFYFDEEGVRCKYYKHAGELLVELQNGGINIGADPNLVGLADTIEFGSWNLIRLRNKSA